MEGFLLFSFGGTFWIFRVHSNLAIAADELILVVFAHIAMPEHQGMHRKNPVLIASGK